jgi:cephalosporin hydroxylase
MDTKTKYDIVVSKLNYLINTSSDINEHLNTLCNYARECESVVELGVRGCISSWAFVAGLLNNGKETKKLFLNDITSCDINELLYFTSGLNIDIKYQWINDLDLELDQKYDLTFIDTWHVYGQLKRELNKFGKITNKYIIMHDTTVDEWHGETIRMGWNAQQQSAKSGIPVQEITKGLWPAIEEFLKEHPEWKIEKRFTNNNGLTILTRIV